MGVSVSDSGFEVLATELYADRGLPHDEVVARLTDGLEGVTLYDAHDYGAPEAPVMPKKTSLLVVTAAYAVVCLAGCKPSHACVLSRPRTF